MGISAICDWQNHPENSNSEWGYEVERALAGKQTPFEPFTREELPRFHDEYSKVLDRAKEVNSNAFRMSLDFAELCPKPGEFNEKLMAHYVKILARCHFLGMEPMVTFHHWTHPKSFAKYDPKGSITHGALEHVDIVDHFAFYVTRVADFLCDPRKIKKAVQGEGYSAEFIQKLCDERLVCRWFISLNEPVNMAFTPYMVGEYPPYQWGRIGKYKQAVKKLRTMHRIVHEDMHDKVIGTQPLAEHDKIKIGMTHQLTNSHMPGFDALANWGLMERMEQKSNSDFIGLQYYFGVRLGLALQALPALLRGGNPMKGPDSRYHSDHPQCPVIYPAGLYKILTETQKRHPDKELLVTEFGFADHSDRKRPDWILETVYHLIRARREGVKVSGMLLWTIVNNFEWVKSMTIPNGIFDAHANRLPTDDGNPDYVSSSQAWAEASSHLINPTDESARRLSDLQIRTRNQLNKFA